MGKLIGRYYDANGKQTEYGWKTWQLIHESSLSMKREETDRKLENQKYPPCNVQWMEVTSVTRVWCTKQSGGIDRNWAGVPRKFFQDNSKDFKCICANEHTINLDFIKEYDDCDPKADTCSYLILD